MISALEYAFKLNPKEVECYLDSKLVVNQVNGNFRVKNLDLKDLWMKVLDLKARFNRISFKHVPRTNKYIEKVDTMVNRRLDQFT